jgi:hypothetical protein
VTKEQILKPSLIAAPNRHIGQIDNNGNRATAVIVPLRYIR